MIHLVNLRLDTLYSLLLFFPDSVIFLPHLLYFGSFLLSLSSLQTFSPLQPFNFLSVLPFFGLTHSSGLSTYQIILLLLLVLNWSISFTFFPISHSVFVFEEEKGFLDKVLTCCICFEREDEQRKMFLNKPP